MGEGPPTVGCLHANFEAARGARPLLQASLDCIRQTGCPIRRRSLLPNVSGRRSKDDERQISRWKGVVGDKGRWVRALVNKILRQAASARFACCAQPSPQTPTGVCLRPW